MRSRIRSFLYNTQTSADCLNVASVTITVAREPEKNLKNIADNVDAIMQSHPDIELVIFGEMLLGWFNPGRWPAYHREIARPITGDILDPLITRCVQYGIYLCFGMPELVGDSLYNSQLLLNPAGEIQAIHRKWNLKPHEREANYRCGSVPVTVTDVKGSRIGMVICADAAHPKTMWNLMKNRLDMIILSLADDSDEDLFMANFNARLYDAWIVTANRYGDEDGYYWNGHTVISDPIGSLRARSEDRAGYLVHDVRFDRDQVWTKRILRNMLVKASLSVHLIKNLKRILQYR